MGTLTTEETNAREDGGIRPGPDLEVRSVDEGMGIHSDDYPPKDIAERKVVSSAGISSSRAFGDIAEVDENGTGSMNIDLDGSRPETSKSRIPSQHSRARFSRTPVPGADQLSSGDDDDDPDGGDGYTPDVLITELKEDEAALLGLVSQRIPVYEESDLSEPEPIDVIDDDMQWDTDLEIEDEQEDDDLTGRSAYVRTCERLGVVPVSYFMRHIEESELVMRYHGLGPQGTRAIASILKDNITVEKLNLSGNDLCSEGGVHMAKMLQENDFITEVSFADNNLGSVGGYHMAKMLMVNTGLRKVDLKGNNFQDKDAEVFAEAIESNKFLRELVLSHNGFGEEAGTTLGPVISSNDILDHLDLSWNHIRKTGAVTIAHGVKENVHLKTCNLSWNGLGPEGGAAIADAIRGNSSLLELDISGNRLDATSAALIAKALQVNDELRVLKMGNNPITTAGAIALVSAINDNDSSVLAFLDLTDIPVEYEFLRIVEELQKKRSFRVIYGPTIRSGNTSEDLQKPGIDPFARSDPLVILREHIIVNDMRILDILQRHDADGSRTVTVEQFAAALDELQVPFSAEQLADIAKKLDRDNSGRIYFGDFFREKETVDSHSGQSSNEDQLSPMPISPPSKTPSMVDQTSKRPSLSNQTTSAPQGEKIVENILLESKTTQTGSATPRITSSKALHGGDRARSSKTGMDSVATLSYTQQISVEQ